MAVGRSFRMTGWYPAKRLEKILDEAVPPQHLDPGREDSLASSCSGNFDYNFT